MNWSAESAAQQSRGRRRRSPPKSWVEPAEVGALKGRRRPVRDASSAHSGLGSVRPCTQRTPRSRVPPPWALLPGPFRAGIRCGFEIMDRRQSVTRHCQFKCYTPLVEFEPPKPDRVIGLVPLEDLTEFHLIFQRNHVMGNALEVKSDAVVSKMLQSLRAQGLQFVPDPA
jgi:hypothetical protein